MSTNSASEAVINKALTDILDAIALSESALDCIMDAHLIKVQDKELEEERTEDFALDLNNSVKALSRTVFRMKALLRFQQENAIELKELISKTLKTAL